MTQDSKNLLEAMSGNANYQNYKEVFGFVLLDDDCAVVRAEDINTYAEQISDRYNGDFKVWAQSYEPYNDFCENVDAVTHGHQCKLEAAKAIAALRDVASKETRIRMIDHVGYGL